MTMITTDGFYEMMAIKGTKYEVTYAEDLVTLTVRLPEVLINSMEILANEKGLELIINDVRAFDFYTDSYLLEYRKSEAIRELDTLTISIPYNDPTHIPII